MNKYKALQINNKLIRLHRYVYQCYIERELKDYEIVHHKDGDINNNNISNLELLNRKEHMSKHPEIRRRSLEVLTKYNIDKELFDKLYYKEKINKRQIAKRLGVYEMKIHKYIKDNNLKRDIYCASCGVKINFKIKLGYCSKCNIKEWRKNNEK